MDSVFWVHLNQGEVYLCDRCKVVELRYDEYDSNRNQKGIFCDECWCFIHLQKFERDGNLVSIRSERKINKTELSEKFS